MMSTKSFYNSKVKLTKNKAKLVLSPKKSTCLDIKKLRILDKRRIDNLEKVCFYASLQTIQNINKVLGALFFIKLTSFDISLAKYCFIMSKDI